MGNKHSKYQVETNIDAGGDKSKEANKTPGIMKQKADIHPPWNTSPKIARPNIKRIQPDVTDNKSKKKNIVDGNEVDERPLWKYSPRVNGQKFDANLIKPIPGKKVDYPHVDKIVDDVMPDNILNQIHPISSWKLKTVPKEDFSQVDSVVDDWMQDEIFDQIRPINSLKVKTYPKEDLSNIDPVIDDRMSYEKLAKIRPIRLAKKNAKNSNIPAKAQSATEPLIAEIEPSLTEASSETKKSESDSHQTWCGNSRIGCWNDFTYNCKAKQKWE